MKGIVKSFDSMKGYGFIYANDESVFFHKSQVLDPIDDVVAGCEVEYSIVQTPKGEQAQNIKIIQQESRKQFIKVGNARIKISNIKNYGLAEDKENYQNELKRCIEEISENEYRLEVNKKSVYGSEAVRFCEKNLIILNQKKEKLEKMLVEIDDFEYLYITTYQGDNYKIYQHEADYNVREILRILDEILL